MDRILTVSEMREADNYTINVKGVPSEVLMFRAGNALAGEVIKTAEELNVSSVTVVCGTGNNGGDGYVCAGRLFELGYDVSVYAVNGLLSSDCRREKERYKGRYSAHICGAIIVDCIFGTGLSRNADGEISALIDAINSAGSYVISADIPSGINGDSGLVSGCAVKADKTVVIGEYKSGLFLSDGADHCGELIKKDIGIECPKSDYMRLYDTADISCFYPSRKRHSHKGTYGTANVIAGSDRYVGAPLLSLSGALKSGCGYVKLTSCEKVKNLCAVKFPQVIFAGEPDFSADCIAVGMGCGVGAELYKTIKHILLNYAGVLIIDADGINALAKYGADILVEKKCRVILTPHLKEFSRLVKTNVETITQNPVIYAKEFSKRYGVALILKSSASVICNGEDKALNVRGSTALAKAGSGDILAGFLCGCVARGLSPFDAAVCATFTLGAAAEIASEEMTDYCANAQDIIKNLHFSVKRLTK